MGTGDPNSERRSWTSDAPWRSWRRSSWALRARAAWSHPPVGKGLGVFFSTGIWAARLFSFGNLCSGGFKEKPKGKLQFWEVQEKRTHLNSCHSWEKRFVFCCFPFNEKGFLVNLQLGGAHGGVGKNAGNVVGIGGQMGMGSDRFDGEWKSNCKWLLSFSENRIPGVCFEEPRQTRVCLQSA